MSIFEAEPTSDLNYREQHAILVASGKAKDMIAVYLSLS